MKKKIWFIINPRSGVNKKIYLPDVIKKYLDHDQFECSVHFTEYAGHATQIAKEAVDEAIDIVAACGGDGTMNEVGRGLVNTATALAVIPSGSGNGLARHLGIPLTSINAIKTLNTGKVIFIDSLTINENPFFNVAGIGFDAEISRLFNGGKQRGFKGYARLLFKNVLKYRPLAYEVQIDNEKVEANVFLLAFANSAQYGNEVYIAPFADIKDGLIDVCLIKNFARWKLPFVLFLLALKKIHWFGSTHTYQAKKITIKCNAKGCFHYDGECADYEKDISVNINPLSLKILVP